MSEPLSDPAPHPSTSDPRTSGSGTALLDRQRVEQPVEPGDHERYAHYVRKGRHRKTVLLGAAQGPCGRIDVRRRQFPFKPAVGRWTLQVDNQAEYSTAPLSVFVRLAIIVREEFPRATGKGS